jgi:16S rRNA (guanine527-N7)-methyltransferase
LHGRAETIAGRVFDTVVARAFAPLPELVASIDNLSGPQTRVLAMKGKWPQDEINGLPPQWHQQGSHELTIPGLAESRCVIILGKP